MTSSQHNSHNKGVLPAWVLLAGAGLGLVVALIVAFTQPTFNVVGIAGLLVGIISLGAWAIMYPQELVALLRGRAVTFGGTALVVTLVFLVALVLVYAVVRQQGWRADFSQSERFSLTDNARQAVALLASDPSAPRLQLVGFLDATQAGIRDRASVLLDDVQRASNGRVSYRFVDPDRDPLTTQAFGAQVGQYALVTLNDDGSPDLQSVQRIPVLTQQTLLDALITASASGDFRAYFVRLEKGISVQDSGPNGASVFFAELRDRYKWNVQEVNLFDLTRANAPVTLNDSAADGEVLLILGGQDALPDSQLKVLTDYLDAGGRVVLLSDFSPRPTLATAENMTTYLQSAWGITVNADLVLDPLNSNAQSPLEIYVNDFGDSTLFADYQPNRDALLFGLARSLTLADTPPPDVRHEIIARTSSEGYAKSNLNFSGQVTFDQLAKADGDRSGALVLGVLAENTRTGARLAVISSSEWGYNVYRQFDGLGIRNFDALRKVTFWAARYENFAETLARIPVVPSATQQPLLGTANDLNAISFWSVIGLPFGVLGLGVLVWWRRRERVQG